MSRLALLSVSDKTGIVPLARVLVDQHRFTLLSSGGTAQAIEAAGIPVTRVADHTGAPEILGGRVKTLHPRIHAGILARRDREQDQVEMESQGIPEIEVVVVNLYPFETTVAQPGVSVTEAMEQIDIGGPTLVRAAAKNYAYVTVLTDPEQYGEFLQQLQQPEGISLAYRWQCARQAFARILTYDWAISAYFDHLSATPPQTAQILGKLHQTLRYGENPHQRAGWYQELGLGAETRSAESSSAESPGPGSGSTGVDWGWCAAQIHQGKELSYNNLVDLEAARAIAVEFWDQPQAAAVIIKHTNPCGVALAETPVEAYRAALAADPISAFGGIVALNLPLDVEVAEALTETFLECVVAPEIAPAALEILQKKKNLRVLGLPGMEKGPAQMVRMIAGGFLMQQSDRQPLEQEHWQVVSQRQPTPEERAELEFAWRVCRHVKSNAIVITQGHQTLGIGAGQMNRVGSVRLALEQAGEKAQGAVVASDAFFPFGDSVALMAEAGIRAVVQPGGSLRDQESIEAADQAELAMVFTGTRHFLH